MKRLKKYIEKRLKGLIKRGREFISLKEGAEICGVRDMRTAKNWTKEIELDMLYIKISDFILFLKNRRYRRKKILKKGKE